MTITGGADWVPGHAKPCYRCRWWGGQGRSHGPCRNTQADPLQAQYRASRAVWTDAGATCARWSERSEGGWADER